MAYKPSAQNVLMGAVCVCAHFSVLMLFTSLHAQPTSLIILFLMLFVALVTKPYISIAIHYSVFPSSHQPPVCLYMWECFFIFYYLIMQNKQPHKNMSL